MKNLAAILICIFLLITGCIYEESSAGGDADEFFPEAGNEDYTADDYASVFKMWQTYGQPYADADKTGQGDSNMCWAAAAANVLTWAGWAADEDDTFYVFKDHFEDETGYVYNALNYYFANYVPGVSVEMVSVRESRSHMLLDYIVSVAHEGKGIIAKIGYPNREYGHFLTIYGYQYDAKDDNFVLYYADSDDNVHKIRQFEVEWDHDDDRWEIQSGYTGWFLEYVISLARN